MTKLLLTICSGGSEVPHAVRDDAVRLVEQLGASRGAVSVRATANERAYAAPYDTERVVDTVVSLWDVATPSAAAAALKLSPPSRLVGAYEVDEVVQRGIDGAAPQGVNLVCFVARRPDISHQQFSDHWRRKHGPLALELQPGFRRYVQNHVQQQLCDGAPELDGIGEILFRSTAAVVNEMFASEEAEQQIYEDMVRFLDLERVTTFPATEYMIP